MSAFLEIRAGGPPAVFPLEARATLGSDPSNGVAIPGDEGVSGLHAVLERYDAGWVIRDVGSTNGTLVNGERIIGERRLRTGDEILVGSTRLVFHSGRPEGGRATKAVAKPPELTRRERDVLLALCAPVLAGDVFSEPASMREMADALVVTENAVKQHLNRLYDKFGIEEGTGRRARLANEAVRTGAVTIAALRESRERRTRR